MSFVLSRFTDIFQSQKIDFLEKSKGWKEPDFDGVLQNLRTVLLRRKAIVFSI